MRRDYLTWRFAVACLPAASLVAAAIGSYSAADSFWFNRANDVRAVIVSSGKVEFYRQRVTAADAPFQILASTGHRRQPPSVPRASASQLRTAWDCVGFGYAAGPDAFGWRRTVIVPFWGLIALIGLPPLWWTERSRRRHVARLMRERRCIRCGYDLRASTERCPECGVAILKGNR